MERVLSEFIRSARDASPWFLYLAYNAPHFPLQAPTASLAKYTGRYDDGYDALHAQRLRFAHPHTGEAMDIEAPPDAEFAKALALFEIAEPAA